MTGEEKARINAEMVARGVACCGQCGDAFLGTGAVPHMTPYTQGRVTVGKSGSFEGTHSVAALCQECWAAMAPEQRWPHYEQALDRRVVRSVRRRVILTPRQIEVEEDEASPTASMTPDGTVQATARKVKRTVTVQDETLVDDAADAERHRRDVAAAGELRQAVQAAVMAGK